MYVVETVRTRKGAEVTILIDGASYVIAGSSGYRATVNVCACSDRTPCPLSYGHNKTQKGAAEGCRGTTSGAGKNFCHGWHLGRVRRLRDKVASTYGKGIRA